MKDSVAKTVPLGDIVDVIGGGTPSKRNPAFYGGEIPWATVRDMNVEHLQETEHSITPAGLKGSSSKIIPAGEIVIATRVGLGKVCILGQDTAINQDLRGLVPKSDVEIDRRFLFHWYTSIADKVIEAGTGATVQGVKLPFVKSLPFPTLTLEEQRRIVAVLDEAFEGLARARTHAEANLQNARDLFPSSIAEIFSNSQGWQTCSVGDIGEVFDGPHATPKTVDQGPLFLGISSLVDGRIELVKTRHVTEENFAKWTRRVEPRAGDVVFSYETRLGQVGLIPDGMRCCLGRRMGLVRLDEAKVSPEFFVAYYLSPYFQDFLRENTVKGATVDRISIKDFPNFPVLLPKKEIQAAVVEQIANLRDVHDRLVEQAVTKLQDIDDLRQSLLQKAFAGELT